MHLSRSVRHRTQSTATPPYSQYSRCSVDLRGQEDAGCVTAAVGGSAPRIQHGRFSARQPVVSRRCAGSVTRPSSGLAPGRSRAQGGSQGHPHQYQRFARREVQSHAAFGASGLTLRPQRKHQKPAPLQECVLLRGLYPASRRQRSHRRPTGLSVGKDSAPSQPPAVETAQRIPFRSKYSIACFILVELLPTD